MNKFGFSVISSHMCILVGGTTESTSHSSQTTPSFQSALRCFVYKPPRHRARSFYCWVHALRRGLANASLARAACERRGPTTALLPFPHIGRLSRPSLSKWRAPFPASIPPLLSLPPSLFADLCLGLLASRCPLSLCGF